MNLREHDDAEIVRRRQDVVAFLQFADNHRSMFAHRPASDGSAYIEVLPSVRLIGSVIFIS